MTHNVRVHEDVLAVLVMMKVVPRLRFRDYGVCGCVCFEEEEEEEGELVGNI